MIFGSCGASYTLINKSRYGCAGARNKGEAISTNCATILREVVEERALTGLRDRLLHPNLLTTFVKEYRRAFNAQAAGADAARKKARRDGTQVDKKISGITAAIKDGMYQPSMKGRMVQLEAEKRTVTSFSDQSPAPPVLRLHPSLSDLYRTKIRNLSSALQDPHPKAEATEAPNGYRIELTGDSSVFLHWRMRKPQSSRFLHGLGRLRRLREVNFRNKCLCITSATAARTFRIKLKLILANNYLL
jgi:hypothetical protein